MNQRKSVKRTIGERKGKNSLTHANTRTPTKNKTYLKKIVKPQDPHVTGTN